MRTFVSMGVGVCAICKTNKEGECILVAIDGSNEDGSLIFEAAPIHTECIELRMVAHPQTKEKVIYQIFKE